MRILIVFILLTSAFQVKSQIKTEWVEHLNGDFSFANNWEYPLGVYINRHGQVSCDGFCPERAWRMKDSTGRVFSDSLQAFYQLVDSSHISCSFQAEVSCYEYSGVNTVKAMKNDGALIVTSSCNASTHSSLELSIIADTVHSVIDYNSIRNVPRDRFEVKYGWVKIDRTLYNRGILKAEFDLKFDNTIGDLPIYWKGKILIPFN